VTTPVSRQLRLDAAAVYHHALCLATTLTPAQHASRYAYYSALVTSLGQTPLPDC
jgi:hypothetical protein